MADYAYVAFLDILGYKLLLQRDILAGTSVFRDKMTRAFRHFENINRARHNYQVISDAIYLSCTDRDGIEEFLGHISGTFIAFLGEGLLIRGGVTFGQHFMNNSVTYSPGLTKAYSLENEVAIFPRIIVDENILDMFSNLAEKSIVRRSGNNYFLNIATADNLEGLWLMAKSACHADSETIRQSEHIRVKHKWLQDYLIDSALIHGIQPQSPYLNTFDELTQAQDSKRQAGRANLVRALLLVSSKKQLRPAT